MEVWKQIIVEGTAPSSKYSTQDLILVTISFDFYTYITTLDEKKEYKHFDKIVNCMEMRGRIYEYNMYECRNLYQKNSAESI